MILHVFTITAISSAPSWARFFVDNISTFRLLCKVSFIAFVVLLVWYLFSAIVNKKKYTEQTIYSPQQGTFTEPKVEIVSQPENDPWKSLLQDTMLGQPENSPVQMTKPGFFSSNASKMNNTDFMPDLQKTKNEDIAPAQEIATLQPASQSNIERTENLIETDDPWKKLMQDSAKQTSSSNKMREIPLSLELEQLTQSQEPQEKQKSISKNEEHTIQPPALEIIKNPQIDRSSL